MISRPAKRGERGKEGRYERLTRVGSRRRGCMGFGHARLFSL
jgi:hypothetical protein